MNVNVWLGIRDDPIGGGLSALGEAKAYVADPEGYSGPITPYHGTTLLYMANIAERLKFWRAPTLGGQRWTIWSLDIDDATVPLATARERIEALVTDFPNHIVIAAAWWWDGRQVGTQWAPAVEQREVFDAVQIFYEEDELDGEGNVIHELGDPVLDELGNPTYSYELRLDSQGDPVLEDWLNPQGTTSGAPLYPLHAQLYQFIPDAYGADENVLPRPTSNAAIIDHSNLKSGQAPRRFT